MRVISQMALYRLVVLVPVFVTVAVSARVALASPPRIAWHAPPPCPDAEQMRARVAARLPPDAAHAAVSVSITHVAGHYTAHVEVADGWDPAPS